MARCADHLGNQYESMAKMCRVWGVSPSTLRRRLDSGMDLRTALTTNRTYKVEGPYVVDHFGNKFRSTQELKKHWNIE